MIQIQESEFDTDSRIAEIIEELENFGINTLSKLDKIIDNVNDSYKFSNENSYVGFLRDIMLITDMEKYFSQCYSKLNDKWVSNDKAGFEFLVQKYTEDEILKTHEMYSVTFED